MADSISKAPLGNSEAEVSAVAEAAARIVAVAVVDAAANRSEMVSAFAIGSVMC